MEKFKMLLLIICSFFSLSFQDEDKCIEKQDCSSCLLEDIKCAWCADIEYKESKCNKISELENNCKKIYNPETTLSKIDRTDGKFINIQPRNINIDFRTGDKINFEITANYLENLPVQLMFLVDFSKSMEDEWDSMIELSKDFGRQFTSEAGSMVGYTVFVDKTTFPIVDHETWDPNNPSNPFYVRIVSPLSNDSKLLTNLMSQAVISTNIDAKEATFEAVYQTAVCDNIGWSTEESVLKTIIAFTDAGTKAAGDGRIVTIYEPHDGKCHLDNKGEWLSGLEMDYPSLNLVAESLKNRSISVIFAVSGTNIKEYKLIEESWKGVSAMVTTLEPGGKNIKSIIENSRKALNSKFIFLNKNNVPEIVNVEASCPRVVTGNKNDVCLNVNKEDTVKFKVYMDFSTTTEQKTFPISISTFGTVEINVNPIKECKCTTEEKPPLIEFCDEHGYDECGSCKCIEGWYGKHCDCQMTDEDSIAQCTDNKTGLVCNGQGTCSCGVCECLATNDVFSGKYCECKNSQCSMYNGEPCGGLFRGLCQCNTCACDELYMGPNCAERNCSNSGWIEQCANPNTNETCSKNGKCECGTCRCAIQFEGEYCETRTNPIMCSDLAEEAYCAAMNKSVNTQECEASKYDIVMDTESKRFNCSVTDDQKCSVKFNFESVDGFNLLVKVKPFDKYYDCEREINWILLAIILFAVIIVIGVIAIILFFVIMYLYDRHQYKKFEEERGRADFGQSANPLYSAPSGNASNPLGNA